jgi:hypothetical protein
VSAQTPKPPDDATDVLMKQQVALHEPTTCGACRVPLVVCEKQLLNEKASRRLWCLCPACGFDFEVLALMVVEGVSAPIEEGTCLFDSEPHKCTHGYSWQCKAGPGGRLRGVWKHGAKKRGKGRKKK